MNILQMNVYFKNDSTVLIKQYIHGPYSTKALYTFEDTLILLSELYVLIGSNKAFCSSNYLLLNVDIPIYHPASKFA